MYDCTTILTGPRWPRNGLCQLQKPNPVAESVLACVFQSEGSRKACWGAKCLRSLGVESISLCCPPIFDWLAPVHEHDGAVSIIRLPRPHSPPSPFCPFPKRSAFLGATTEAALEGRPAGSWVASSALAPRGGDNVLLIDWVSWAEFRNLQKGEARRSRDEGCAGRNGWGGGLTGEDSQSTNEIRRPLSHHVDKSLIYNAARKGRFVVLWCWDVAVLYWSESSVDFKQGSFITVQSK